MNKRILDRVGVLAAKDKHSASLINQLLQYEESAKGWYKDDYYKAITKHCPEDDFDEN